ncbi:MAG: T9SS type A sorting domain-containing protein [Bacteroidia bacterium]
MKKFTILCAIVFASVSVFATSGNNIVNSRSGKAHSRLAPASARHIQLPHATHQQSRVAFFTEDFSAGIPAGWTNVDSNNVGVAWKWTTTGAFQPNVNGDDNFLSPTGTSAANGYMMYDSDSANASIGGEWAILTSNAIDCSTHPTVRLTMNEYFLMFEDAAAIFPNTGHVYVSTDSTTWYLVHAAEAGLTNNTGTPNPSAVVENISAIAGGASTVYLKFVFTGDWSWYWMFDDVELSELPSVDAGVVDDGFIGEYPEIPINQAEAFAIEGRIVNNSGSDLTNASLSFDVFLNDLSTNVFTGTSSVVPLIAAGDTSPVLTASYVPSDTGLYILRQVVSVAGDADGSNDTTFSVVYVNDSVYARDFTDFDASGYLGGFGFNGGQGTLGQMFHIYQGSQFTSVTGFFDAPTEGDSIRFSVYTTAAGMPDLLIASTDAYVINATDAAGGFITVEFPNNVNVLPGDYFVGVEQINTNNVTIGAISEQYTPGKVFFDGGSGWVASEDAGFNFAFILRPNNPSSTFVGVKNVTAASEVTVYPNPSKGVVYLMNNGVAEKDVTVNVINSVGQVVMSRTFSSFMNEKIDLRNCADGVYTLQVRTATGVTNKSIVISAK